MLAARGGRELHPLGQFPDGKLVVAQQFDRLEAVRMREDAQCGGHAIQNCHGDGGRFFAHTLNIS